MQGPKALALRRGYGAGGVSVVSEAYGDWDSSSVFVRGSVPRSLKRGKLSIQSMLCKAKGSETVWKGTERKRGNVESMI